MTVSSSTSKVQYNGDGSTAVFPYTFKVFDQDDLTVIIRSVTGTEITKTVGTHYTVSGVGGAGGGNVTMLTAPASGEQLTILREQGLVQELDLVPNDPFPAQSLEDALDKLTFMVQTHSEELDRSIKASKTNSIGSTEFTVLAADRANKVFAFDGAGELSVAQELGTYRASWSTATAYAERDIVKDTSNSNIYICLAAHTSSGVLPVSSNADVAKWGLIVDAAAAGASAAAAAASEAAADLSQVAAAASEGAAAASEAAASASAVASAGSASASQASATAAAASQTAAASSASAASTSASNAAASASNAATSATASSNAATSAATSASNAATSASNASTSASAAAGSATSASTSASSASASASAAAGSASTATTQAAAASSSASAANTSAVNAAASEVAAAASAALASDRVAKTSDIGSALIPTGTEAQRDVAPSAGYFRFNLDLSKFEGYNGASWGSVGGGATGGGADAVFIENDQAVTASYTIAADKNAMTTGPITINSGVVVTVSTGARWVVI